MPQKNRPGEVRDAIIDFLLAKSHGANLKEISRGVVDRLGVVPSSSIRSYLQLNTPGLFARSDRAQYTLDESFLRPPDLAPTKKPENKKKPYRYGNALLIHADCTEWLRER